MSDRGRYLIVNADDFGQSPGINQGIIQAHERGIVTSTSLMVRWPAAAAAVDYGRRHPELSVGLHIDLCEWAFRDGQWTPVYEIVPFHDAGAVQDEIRRQVERFHELWGGPPTHLDSHQHFHTREPARLPVLEIADRLGIPARSCGSRVAYCGRFYGQTDDGRPLPELIGVEALLRVLRELPEGVTELGCHPGLSAGLDTMYAQERERELETLCDARIRDAIASEGIVLRTFHNPWTL